MSARRHPAAIYLALKAATRRLVTISGGQEAAAAISRVRQQEFSNYGNPAAEFDERFAPIDVIADLEGELGDPVVTRALAAISGHILIRAPEALAAETDELGLLKSAKESTEAVAAGWAAKQDGMVTPTERAHVAGQIREAIVALHELEARWGQR